MQCSLAEGACCNQEDEGERVLPSTITVFEWKSNTGAIL